MRTIAHLVVVYILQCGKLVWFTKSGFRYEIININYKIRITISSQSND